MTQFRELQCLHWGPLPPDPIPLVTRGVNVAAGPNGAGKTCALDALKLMLGVEKLKQRPRDWIFKDDASGRRAERAYIRVVFANPERPGRRGRLFADVGYGCEQAEWVTAICEISRDGRRERQYTIVPGHQTWGRKQPLEQDIAALREIPQSRWYSSTQWREILRRAGVPQALLRVISVRAGETDQMLLADPKELLRRMLELTGKQETLDAFRQAKRDLADARREHADAHDRLRSERRELDKLELLVRRFESYQQTTALLRRIEAIELPWALRREKQAAIDEREAECRQREEANERHRATLATLAVELPARERRQAELAAELEALTEAQAQAKDALAEAAGDERQARNEHDEARQLVAAAPDKLDALLVAERTEHAEAAERALAAARKRAEAIAGEIAELRAGRPLRPIGLDRFRELLADAGIASVLLAEQLEPGHQQIAAEAALGEGVWTLVVAADRLEQALTLARQHGHRLPIAAAGIGAPAGVLAELDGYPDAGAYLAEVDLPLATRPGVDEDGTVRGASYGVYRGPERPVLGAKAREHALAEAEAEAIAIRRSLPRLETDAHELRAQASLYARAVNALAQLPELARQVEQARTALEAARDQLGELDQQSRTLAADHGKGERELDTRREDKRAAEREIADNKTRLSRLSGEIGELEADLATLPEPDERPTTERERAVLEAERETLQGRLLHEFSDEERSPEVVVARDKQAQHVGEAQRVLGEHDEKLGRAQEQLAEARRRYEQHVRESVHRLAHSFRDVCAKAAMTGELKLVPDESEAGEHALSVRVAHSPEAPGEALAPYHSGAHSDGQRAKISILLLLAAMGAEGASDLLIMDEHSAHLDSRNIDYIGEAMRALSEQVQFILATPVTAEAARAAGWCDHQLAFFPAEDGEPFARLSIFTRRPQSEDELHVGEQIELAGELAG